MDMFINPPESHRDEDPISIWRVISAVLSWALNILLEILIAILVYFRLHKSATEKKLEDLHKQLDNAATYNEWLAASKELDCIEGNEAWKHRRDSNSYDAALLEHRLTAMRKHSQNGDLDAMVMALRAGLLRNLGGMGNPHLFNRTRVGTKRLIEEYSDEVMKQLHFICDSDFEDFPLEAKFDFFYETRQAFGRSALLLSGGATLGMYHFGVVKALFESDLLPRVISGSSVGSIVASIISIYPDNELTTLFEKHNWKLNAFENLGPGSLRRKVVRLFTKGVLMDVTKLQECLRDNIGDITFKEAYDRSKRILNITVASTSTYEFTRLLNYLTAPNVLIWSAACASCALRFLYEPVELMAKDRNGKVVPYHPSGLKWSDGSVEADLPMDRLSELFNINHFIVSQVNPHVVPFVASDPHTRTDRVSGIMGYLLKSEIKHRVTQAAQLKLLPTWLSGIHPLITQKYVGDITIIPKVTLTDYMRIVSNPTEEMIINCVKKGQRSTWPKLSIIKNHCAVELELDRCTAKLRERLYHKEKTRSVMRKSPSYSDPYPGQEFDFSRHRKSVGFESPQITTSNMLSPFHTPSTTLTKPRFQVPRAAIEEMEEEEECDSLPTRELNRAGIIHFAFHF